MSSSRETACMYESKYFEWLKKESSTKNKFKIFDGVGMSYHTVCKYN